MNRSIVIKEVNAVDKRYKLKNGAGSDAVHNTSTYGYAICVLKTDSNQQGIGLAFTLGAGNTLVCEAIQNLAKRLEGKEINELMTVFGALFNTLADDPDYRWLGPHKGVVHLALAAITNACYDLWAKSRCVPLWKLLNDLSPESLVDTLDFTYIEDVLCKEEALKMLMEQEQFLAEAEKILQTGYKGYDTSVGWFNYSDDKIRDNVKRAIDSGFTAVKLKVGSKDHSRDIRRAILVRETAGDDITIMLDANQQWSLPEAIKVCNELNQVNPYWIEEPTHPDDVNAHKILAAKIAPAKIALGGTCSQPCYFQELFAIRLHEFQPGRCCARGGDIRIYYHKPYVEKVQYPHGAARW